MANATSGWILTMTHLRSAPRADHQREVAQDAAGVALSRPGSSSRSPARGDELGAVDQPLLRVAQQAALGHDEPRRHGEDRGRKAQVPHADDEHHERPHDHRRAAAAREVEQSGRRLARRRHAFLGVERPDAARSLARELQPHVEIAGHGARLGDSDALVLRVNRFGLPRSRGRGLAVGLLQKLHQHHAFPRRKSRPERVE